MHFYIYVCMELNKNIFKGLALAAGFFIYFVGALRQGQTWSVPQKVQLKKKTKPWFRENDMHAC